MSVINIVVDGLAPKVINLDAAISVAGPEGPQGETGPQGAQGIQGVKGDKGDQGIQGPAGAGSGDMLASVYDPTAKAANAFSMDNMVEGTGTKIMTNVERAKLGGISSGADVTGSANVEAAGAFMIASDNLDDINVGATNKHFTATEKTKLSGVETGAEVTSAAKVDAAGAVMVADTATTGMGFVVDEDNMASDSATKLPTQQSVKAYVDTSIAASGGGDVSGPSGSATNELALFSDTSGKVLKRGTGVTYTEATGTIKRDAGITVEASSANTATIKSGTAGIAVNQTSGIVVTGGMQVRIDPRHLGFAPSTTPDVSIADTYSYHILSVNITINSPIGTPKAGNKLMFSFKDNGTSKTITWNSIFKPTLAALPTATVPNKWTHVGVMYVEAVNEWQVLAAGTQV